MSCQESDISTTAAYKQKSGQRAWLADPRVPFAGLLALYCILGCTVLGFNRTPLQIFLTVTACAGLDWTFNRLLRQDRTPRSPGFVPLSACISGMGLSILLNYSHNLWLLFLPVFFCVASKYLLTFEGRHVFNPAMCGVVGALFFGGGLFASAPAYQWGGTLAVAAPIVMAALCLFVFKIGRKVLILSFLFFYVLQTAIRAYLMRWHLPPETVLLGSLTSPAFFLFAFYMITDPRTSPVKPWGTGWLGVGGGRGGRLVAFQALALHPFLCPVLRQRDAVDVAAFESGVSCWSANGFASRGVQPGVCPAHRRAHRGSHARLGGLHAGDPPGVCRAGPRLPLHTNSGVAVGYPLRLESRTGRGRSARGARRQVAAGHRRRRGGR